MAKEYLVITTVGPDRRGIVEKVTQIMVSHQANIEESRMARLGGEFAVIMLLSLPEEKRVGLLAGLEALQTFDLTVFSRPTSLTRLEKFQGFVPYEISVVGADHEGIVHSVARYLFEEQIQVESMDTHISRAPNTGTPIFSMYALVAVPPSVTLPALRQKLAGLADDLGVDIEVKLPVN